MQTRSIDRRQWIAFGFVVLLTVAAWNGMAPKSPQVKSVSVPEARALIDGGALVIDVRDKGVGDPSHVPGALLIPYAVLAGNLQKIEAYRDRQIVVYCNDGHITGPQATEMLNKAGFSLAVNLQSGIEGWRAAGMPTKGS